MAQKLQVTFRGDDLGVFDADDVTMNEALQLEDQTGLSINEMIQSVARSSAKGYQAMVWFQGLRSGKPMELHQDFSFRDVDIDSVPAPETPPAGPTTPEAAVGPSEPDETSTSPS